MGLKTIQFRMFTTPDGKPTCKTKEGQCFFLGGNMRGERFCMYAHEWADRANARVFRYDDNVNGFLEPHVDCLMSKEEVL